jgi:hypothetical protein
MKTELFGLEDYDLAIMLAKERADRLYPLVPYRRLILRPSEIDDIHKEIEETRKRFSDPVMLRGFVEPDQETYPLNRFGLEQVRNVVLHVVVLNLIEAGLASQDRNTREVKLHCSIGDRFTFSGYVYDVLSIAREHHWTNTDIPLDFAIRAERFRSEATEFEGIG